MERSRLGLDWVITVEISALFRFFCLFAGIAAERLVLVDEHGEEQGESGVGWTQYFLRGQDVTDLR